MSLLIKSIVISISIVAAITGVCYLAYLGNFRNDCEGLMTQELYLREIVKYEENPVLYEQIVFPVSAKRVEVCIAMYKGFATFWPEKDPFHVGR